MHDDDDMITLEGSREEMEYFFHKSMAWCYLCDISRNATGLDGAYLNAMIRAANKSAEIHMLSQAPMRNGDRLGLIEPDMLKQRRN